MGVRATVSCIVAAAGGRVSLDPVSIVETARRLEARVGERFPGRGIHDRAGDLVGLAERAQQRASEIGSPIRWVRLALAVLGVLVLVALTLIPFDIDSTTERDAFDWIQVVESALNDLILIGAGAFFLFTIETRLKRRRCLRELHQLRSFAHVVDMIQLTKDPQRQSDDGHDTASSPERDLDEFELSRYLDYCSEMLAVTGKIAALYVQDFDDPVAISTVNDIEDLTTGLSRKIWQKLTILSTQPRDPD